jgi:hypothetical protein
LLPLQHDIGLEKAKEEKSRISAQPAEERRSQGLPLAVHRD